jgi:large subunit ribosomal protein L20
MARIKGAQNRKVRRKNIMARAKGFRGARNNTLRQAHQAVMKARSYAYRGRKERKRQFRRLWIIRINAALTFHELSYSKFIHGLKLANIDLDRKALAEIAYDDADAFGTIVESAKKALA